MENKEKKQKRERGTKPANSGVYAIGVKVLNGNIEGALKKFKKLVKDSGKINELRDRQSFDKPSVIKRQTKMKAIRRNDLNKLENTEL